MIGSYINNIFWPNMPNALIADYNIMDEIAKPATIIPITYNDLPYWKTIKSSNTNYMTVCSDFASNNNNHNRNTPDVIKFGGNVYFILKSNKDNYVGDSKGSLDSDNNPNDNVLDGGSDLIIVKLPPATNGCTVIYVPEEELTYIWDNDILGYYTIFGECTVGPNLAIHGLWKCTYCTKKCTCSLELYESSWYRIPASTLRYKDGLILFDDTNSKHKFWVLCGQYNLGNKRYLISLRSNSDQKYNYHIYILYR
jgi:hypothetical protein